MAYIVEMQGLAAYDPIPFQPSCGLNIAPTLTWKVAGSKP